MKYEDFLRRKAVSDVYGGFAYDDLNPNLFDFQNAIVHWALKKSRAAIFADTGLGKTLMQLSWADAVCKYTGGKVLIVTPLCIAPQTLNEGLNFGIISKYCRHPSETLNDNIIIVNYEMLDYFDASDYIGVVLDESSILKGIDSKTRSQVIKKFENVPYRLSCTATPSPNDYMELGSQAEFLGVMKHTEMLAMFFTHDGKETSKWRLKGHGKSKFWEWLSTWAVFIRNPEDLGFDGTRYKLPPLRMFDHQIDVDIPVAITMTERRIARKVSVKDRCLKMAELVNKSDDYYVVWCNLNEESALLSELIPDAVEVHGSLPTLIKEQRLISFSEGRSRVIVSKPKISGYGLNWQHCRNVGFVGLDDSFEKYYQAVRRCYRFGQKREVNVDIIYTSAEGAVKANLERKQMQADIMANEMIRHMQDFTKREVIGTTKERTDYKPLKSLEIPSWL